MGRNSDNGAGFGTSVAVSGNIIVVGAADTSNFHHPAATPGAVYVFVKPAGGWKDMTETVKLTASDGLPGDAFGNSVGITQSVWHGKIQTVKSLKGNRLCEISSQLIEHLRQYIRQWRPNQLGLMFASKNGTPWDTDTVRKRKLYPLLDKLDILQCGFHAFRHGNETVMDPGERADGSTASPSWSLGRENHDAVLARRFRGWKAVRRATRRAVGATNNARHADRQRLEFWC